MVIVSPRVFCSSPVACRTARWSSLWCSGVFNKAANRRFVSLRGFSSGRRGGYEVGGSTPDASDSYYIPSDFAGMGCGRHGRYITIESGMFHAHPNDLGGPFQSLTGAMDAIKLYNAKLPTLPKGYYFTLKDGLFHIKPDDLGGPFGRLDDATNAIRKHLKPPPFDYMEEGREKIRRMTKLMSDPSFYRPTPQPKLSKSPTKDTDSSVHNSEQEILDPVVLEAIAMFNRMEMEEEAKRNGMRWMQNEVTKAFENYLSSTETKDVKYEFQKLEHQCLIYPKAYHHYNFTMKIKLSSERRWVCKTFFAEVKPTEKGKHYFCCPLQITDNGRCFGCSNVGIKLRHPAGGGYDEGNVDSSFPFNTDGDVK